MSDDEWCEFCQDHFPVSHFGDDGAHLVGTEYGQEGALLARSKALGRVIARLAGDHTDVAKELRALIGPEVMTEYTRASRSDGEPGAGEVGGEEGGRGDVQAQHEGTANAG